MSADLLTIDALQTELGSGPNAVRACDGLSMKIREGETFALVGESGCGKSMTALSIMRLLPEPAGRIVGGSIRLGDVDLLDLPEAGMRAVRGKRIGMIFQEPMTSLNPVMTIGQQIMEGVSLHRNVSRAQAREISIELLDDVGIPDPVRRFSNYPHQLSGGMKQRVMIAIALSGLPDLLIADEPTTALDVTIQAQVLDLLAGLQSKLGMSVLLITHDLGVVAHTADRVAVMYAGQIVEQADSAAFFRRPVHPYSRMLFDSLPVREKRGSRLSVIPGSVPELSSTFHGCRFEPRCDIGRSVCSAQLPVWTGSNEREDGARCHFPDKAVERSTHVEQERAVEREVSEPVPSGKRLLQVEGLKVHFPVHKGVFRRVVGHVRAVDGVGLDIGTSETVALVGESGCGKTTVGKSILQLIRPTDGVVRFQDTDLCGLSEKSLRPMRSKFQIIFQDPYSSMNPRMRVGQIVEEGMLAQKTLSDRSQRQARIAELLTQVGLSPEHADRYPHEFSGGQRQRVCIARALAVNPALIVCDEPTSALDVSVQAQVLNLLKSLQDELALGYLFITHDLSVVGYLAHRVAVMYLGRIVEYGPVGQVMDSPRHPYTRALLEAVPEVDGDGRRVMRLEGDMPSPLNPPAGCYFHPRCPQAMPECSQAYPPQTSHDGGSHRVSCFLYR